MHHKRVSSRSKHGKLLYDLHIHRALVGDHLWNTLRAGGLEERSMWVAGYHLPVRARTQTQHKRGSRSAQHEHSRINPLPLVARNEQGQYLDSEPSGVLLGDPRGPRGARCTFRPPQPLVTKGQAARWIFRSHHKYFRASLPDTLYIRPCCCPIATWLETGARSPKPKGT
jgi:hypothetical protein